MIEYSVPDTFYVMYYRKSLNVTVQAFGHDNFPQNAYYQKVSSSKLEYNKIQM